MYSGRNTRQNAGSKYMKNLQSQIRTKLKRTYSKIKLLYNASQNYHVQLAENRLELKLLDMIFKKG